MLNVFTIHMLREHVKKLAFIAGQSTRGGESDPPQLRYAIFFIKKKMGRFEMKNRIKIVFFLS